MTTCSRNLKKSSSPEYRRKSESFDDELVVAEPEQDDDADELDDVEAELDTELVEDWCRNSVSILKAPKLDNNDEKPDDVEEDVQNDSLDTGSASYPEWGTVSWLSDADSFLLELDGAGAGEDDDEDLNPELRVGNCIVITSIEFLTDRNLIKNQHKSGVGILRVISFCPIRETTQTCRV
jgi:hypothetical protein